MLLRTRKLLHFELETGDQTAPISPSIKALVLTLKAMTAKILGSLIGY